MSTLVNYSTISQLAANFLKTGDIDPVQAVNIACDCYLPSDYIATPAAIRENIYKAMANLQKMRRQAS